MGLLSLLIIGSADRVPAADEGLVARPLADPGSPPPPSAVADATLFQRLDPKETGVTMTIPIDTTHPLKRLYYSSSAGSGVAIGDLDLDGRPDIYAGSGPGKNALYLQREPWKFTDVAEDLGVDLDDHIDFCISEMKTIASELGLVPQPSSP